MGPIVTSAEIAQPPDDAFRYVTDPSRSRVTIELDFDGHGVGKLLVPLVVPRQAQRQMPTNMEKLKARFESGA